MAVFLMNYKMFRDIQYVLPIHYRQKEIFRNLSCDWQIYSFCNNCNSEQRVDPGLADSNNVTSGLFCGQCKSIDSHIVRHLIRAEFICRECSCYVNMMEVTDLHEIACSNCTSRNLTILNLSVYPEFPEKFNEYLYQKKNPWGTDAEEDSSEIIRLLMSTNTLPDRELHFLPMLKLCERLRLFSKYNSSSAEVTLWNLEGNLLRDYFRATDDFQAGISAFDAFEKCVGLAEDPISQAFYVHNLSMICYSLLVKHPQEIWTVHGAIGNLKEVGISSALSALNVFESDEGKSYNSSAGQAARLHYLVGDLYKIHPYTQADLRKAIRHLDIALDSDGLSNRERDNISYSKSITLSRITAPDEAEKMTELAGLKAAAFRDEGDRAYSEKWQALVSLYQFYWANGDFEDALKCIEEAAAKAIHDLERTADLSTVERRSRQFSEVFKALVTGYIKFYRGKDAVLAIGKYRGLVLKLSTSEIDKKSLTKKAKELLSENLNQLLSGKAAHTRLDKLVLSDSSLTHLLNDLTFIYGNTATALFSQTIFAGISSVSIVILKGGKWKIKTFQWEIDKNLFKANISSNASAITEASIFREQRVKNIRKASDTIIPREILETLRQDNVTTLGLSIPSILNLFPFEILGNENGSGEQLIDQFKVFYYPFIDIMRGVATSIDSKNIKVLIIPYQGDDLSESATELATIRGIGANRVTVFEGSKFPKNDLIRLLEGDFDYIHFICHGSFDIASPIKSTLIIDNNKGDSGKLYADEISHLKLKNRPIITLSACSSGLTSVDQFESYSGLSGSFIQAGAKGIVGSRWEVPDKYGCDFMCRLYYNIFNKNQHILDNVYEAQLHFKNVVRDKNWPSFSYLGQP